MSWGVPPWNLPIHNFPIQCCIHDLRGRISGAQPQSWAVDVFCRPQWSMAWWHIWHGMDVPWPTMIRHDPSLPDVRVLYSAKKPQGALLNYSPPNQYDLRALGRSSTSSGIEMSWDVIRNSWDFRFHPVKVDKEKRFDFISIFLGKPFPALRFGRSESASQPTAGVLHEGDDLPDACNEFGLSLFSLFFNP